MVHNPAATVCKKGSRCFIYVSQARPSGPTSPSPLPKKSERKALALGCTFRSPPYSTFSTPPPPVHPRVVVFETASSFIFTPQNSGFCSSGASASASLKATPGLVSALLPPPPVDSPPPPPTLALLFVIEEGGNWGRGAATAVERRRRRRRGEEDRARSGLWPSAPPLCYVPQFWAVQRAGNSPEKQPCISCTLCSRVSVQFRFVIFDIRREHTAFMPCSNGWANLARRALQPISIPTPKSNRVTISSRE